MSIPNDQVTEFRNASVAEVDAWQDDPGAGANPVGGALVTRPTPNTEKGPFPTKIQGKPPIAKRYDRGSAEFRYWVAASALRRASDFWGEILPNGTWQTNVGPTLNVVLEEGVDLNAYYNRRTLSFFKDTVQGRTVYSAESPDIVCHEFGHAVLDAIRPQLWSTASYEPSAFHESFGDMSAILTALGLPEMRMTVLHETDGRLNANSRLSRLAEQLGWAIRQRSPHSVDADSLRNAANAFTYIPPLQLPASGPASMLSREVHSHSRLFTGAFLDALAGMFATERNRNEETLRAVSVTLGKLLVEAVRSAPITARYFAQVAAQLVALAMEENESYGAAIQRAMSRRGILSAASAFAITAGPQKRAAFAAAVAAPQPALKEVDLSDYGFSVPKIKVQAAAETSQFRALSFGAMYKAAEAALDDDGEESVFVADLIHSDCLDGREFAPPQRGIAPQTAPKTHYLEKVGGDVFLRRAFFDCVHVRR
ncbi:hypothetical protein [Polyangium sp. y55x31]|uniref:hypothetical protein n=1 Tax=Polyangium sp. y55x31 TaxID=3042688 RepID=UPI002482AD3A|nr:hypothetical protein [Polyangium sp. y55x31]MDI1480339.1 hypothetical protein [Polyangium sp. y55x31]